MATELESRVHQGRKLAEFGSAEGGAASTLVEVDGGARYLVWRGPTSAIERVESFLEKGGESESVFPVVVEPLMSAEVPTRVLEVGEDDVEVFDIWKWRNVDSLRCVEALRRLARGVRAVHEAGWTLDGLEREDLLFSPASQRLILGAMPRLRPLDDERETIWRDLRLFGELAYENFLEHEYPGGHQLVTLLQDREAMAETGITQPGLSQLLAGCVTPYGDLAYHAVDELLEGLDNLYTELVRPPAYRVGSRSTQGSYIFRQNNQDSCGHIVVDTTCGSRQLRVGFFCVADGIGGIEDGQRASQLAVETACSSFLRAWNHYDGQMLREYPVAFARSIAQITSQRLALEGDFAPEKNRGGTTFTGLLLAGDRAGLGHVGDSRALLIRESRSIPMTRDHTLASILERLGETASDDDASQRTISRFFSTGTELEYRRIDGIAEGAKRALELSDDQRRARGFSVRPGDVFLLTSDGAHGELSPPELERLLALHRDEPQRLCDAIVDKAIEKIGRDNATSLAVYVE